MRSIRGFEGLDGPPAGTPPDPTVAGPSGSLRRSSSARVGAAATAGARALGTSLPGRGGGGRDGLRGTLTSSSWTAP